MESLYGFIAAAAIERAQVTIECGSEGTISLLSHRRKFVPQGLADVAFSEPEAGIIKGLAGQPEFGWART
jgi:hypothetical protein